MGQNAELIICGTVPPEGVSHPRMRVIPFIDKTHVENRKELSRLFLDAHFMLFPTERSATGIVTCEASAHGLPTLVSNTGGVGGAINDGVNGFLMPFDSGGMGYAQKIIEVISDPERYHRLVQSTGMNMNDVSTGTSGVNPFASSWRTSSGVPLRFMPALRPYLPALPVDAQRNQERAGGGKTMRFAK